MKFFYILLSTTLVVWLVSCKPNYDAPCRAQVVADSFLFSAEQQAVMPYSSKDTLVYISVNNDTIQLLTSIFNTTPTIKQSTKPSNPECPNDFNSHASQLIVLKDSLTQTVLSYTASQYSGLCTFTVAAVKIEIPLAQIGLKDSTFMDSVMLGQNMFYNVTIATNHNGQKEYINAKYGLLQFASAGKRYSLIKFNNK